MSNNLRKYIGLHNTETLSVTATMLGKHGSGIQFTMHDANHTRTLLSENQVKDLIIVLQKRLKCIEGYSATGYIPEKIIKPKKI